MELFYEKVLEMVANYGVFALLFAVVLIMLYRKYEGDADRFKRKEDEVNLTLLKNQEVILATSENTARILMGISETQKDIQSCLTTMNTELRVFTEVQKHKAEAREKKDMRK